MKHSWIVNRCRLRSYIWLSKLNKLFSGHRLHPLNLTHVLRIIARTATTQPFFIQIGAFDGVSNDPLFDVVRTWNWKGVLVEPVPHNYEQLKANYAGSTDLFFENLAISDQSGDFMFYHLPAKYQHPPWLQQIGSFSYEAIVNNLKYCHPELIQHIVSKPIPAITLQQLIDRRRIEQVDVMVIDVEGYEHKVLTSIEAIKNKPKIIVFEMGCMTKLDLQTTVEKLERSSYQIFSAGADLIAIHEAAVEAY